MATYIHKNGPETGTIVLQNYELGISDAAYIYSSISGNVLPLKTKYSDEAGKIESPIGPIGADDIFLLNGLNQIVTDPEPTFTGNLVVNNKITCPTFDGTATRAKYADLAENYESDETYEVGTVLFIGDKTEVSVKTSQNPVAGIVSDKPGYLLNSELQGTTATIALKGRIPVKVSTECKRGDILVADRDNPGFAKTDKNVVPMDILGVCITDSKDGIAEIKV
jgi:hypothetical protein